VDQAVLVGTRAEQENKVIQLMEALAEQIPAVDRAEQDTLRTVIIIVAEAE
jgi:hypothetical protein